MEPTSRPVLAVWALVGLVLGWLVHPVTARLGTPPTLTWSAPAALAVCAAVVGAVAWSTWRAVQVRRERLDSGQGMNRLVLARACAYAGSLVAGGYVGYALSWVGDPAELADERMLRSGAAALASFALVVASLVLERACRVPGGGDDDHDSPSAARP
ncbi:MAG: hypothetical protein CMH83_01290 [Nocardioides sp.]|nr:hypothetical protein [Nocardioides sp.]